MLPDCFQKAISIHIFISCVAIYSFFFCSKRDVDYWVWVIFWTISRHKGLVSVSINICISDSKENKGNVGEEKVIQIVPFASSEPEAKSLGSIKLKSTLQHLFSCSWMQEEVQVVSERMQILKSIRRENKTKQNKKPLDTNLLLSWGKENSLPKQKKCRVVPNILYIIYIY